MPHGTELDAGGSGAHALASAGTAANTSFAVPFSSKLGAGLIALALIGSLGCKKQPAVASGTTPDSPAARKALKQPFTPPPAIKKDLYPAIDQAGPDIAKAEKQAAAQGKRVLLDFGGDWCGDCQVLDIYFHQEPNASLLNNNFVKVNINIGHEDANVDIAHKYGVPLQGVPALAVLSPDGKVLTSQNQEFSDMRYMEPNSVTEFLTKWKPTPGA